MTLNIKHKYENDSWIFYVEGELDVSCAKTLTESIDFCLDQNMVDLRIDMTNLNYIDSTGIGVIVGSMKRVRRCGKDIVLLNAKENIKKILKITGIDQIIRMEG